MDPDHELGQEVSFGRFAAKKVNGESPQQHNNF